MGNKTGTLPAVGPFARTENANRPHKRQPERCYNKHVQVKCGDKPGNRRVVLAPAESFDTRFARALFWG